ncbi:hypothetical protein [Streptomyces sp.]|uniref:hypothetical protein n=1 Tax=Streptomyces sp. TaxID=1931 RepID=UPI002D78B691|nr:hypothetical protein [Streptomyces sp.]HET6354883.1 hypothetical protein [Streptomyces sp.]
MDQYIELDINVEHDGFNECRDLDTSHDEYVGRSIFLRIRKKASDSYAVTAFGNEFEQDGTLYLEGVIHRSREEIDVVVSTLLRGWLKTVVHHQPNEDSAYTFEGSPVLNFGEDRARQYLAGVGLELARYGYQLFTFLFGKGDAGLARLHTRLKEALRRAPQTITVISDDLFVPWGMLYVPADPQTRITAKDAHWDWSGFLGYTHLIEQTLPTAEHVPPYRIGEHSRRPRAGLQLDLRVLNPDNPTGPLAPVHAIIDQHTDYVTRSCKQDVADAFSDPEVIDEILLFGAHGTAERIDDRGQLQAQVTLTDDEPIYSSDLDFWLRERKERLQKPLCFMMVCEAGRTATFLHEGLGRPLFELGVGCLIGPQIEVPITFAGLYTHRFFRKAFAGTRVAEITRDLTQEFLGKHANPLGMIFTLLRGIDTYLVLPGQRKEQQ